MIAGALLAAGLGFAAFLRRGDETSRLDGIYARLFGDPDLGPVDFAHLERRPYANDALACPEGRCPGIRVDLVSPVFPVPPERLRAIVMEVAANEPGAEVVGSAEGWQDQYVVRSRVMRFPDTVSVEIFGLGPDRSTLALYSRSQIGHYDFGVNRARIERWLERIGAIAAEPPPVSEG
jgi:uncharacterized protein (DUF1499 family)